ncbi:MAG: ABC transporter ATP-binding protein [Clostridia bacterium]|jgi:ABC-2 type transport system ATP-binding protein
MDAIETMNLTKYYGKARGIINLSLTVGKGECFGFIGPNGAGKSTTIRTLLGLISPTSGSARILGKDIVKEKTDILRDTGYLPSEVMFYPGMRVRDILKFSADLRRKDCSEEARKLCERLQLDLSAKAEELSYGNRKKVAIVCALQSKPSLLILDEPTGGLDPLMQHEFFEIIRERNRDGATILFSSHILSEVQRNCTRAAVIREGQIVACDSVENLAKTNARRITVYGAVDLTGMDGIRDLKSGNGSASFLYSGDVNVLLRRLSEGHVEDLSITEPDLEEVFLHFYEKGGEQA